MTALHLSTLISRSASPILTHLSRLSGSFPNHPLLFSLSYNASRNDLSNLVDRLTSFSDQTLGCLSAPLPGRHSSFTMCSVVVFDREDVVPFRSTVPGRRQAQVGRWRPIGGQPTESNHNGAGVLGEGVKDWEEVWNGNLECEVIQELKALRPDDVASVIYMSDRSPEGLSHSLTRFSNASKIGLIASSTPFVTGRPFTLFRNKEIYDSGAVGFALKRNKNKMPSSTTKVSFLDLVPISEPMRITQCEGNMVISLNDQNPTRLLLSLIRDSGLDANLAGIIKDEVQFALGVVEGGEIEQVLNITAGDPSRGTISLDAQRSPRQGTLVQFLHRKKPTADPLSEHGIYFSPCIPSESPLYAPKSFNFLSLSDALAEIRAEDETFVLGDMFLAASENGFVVGQRMGGAERESGWTCNVPGALVTLEFA